MNNLAEFIAEEFAIFIVAAQWAGKGELSGGNYCPFCATLYSMMENEGIHRPDCVVLRAKRFLERG